MIKELHEKLINKEITAVELAEQYFSVIEKKDKDLNAYLTLMREEALEQARKVDEKIARGEEIAMLEGIPGGIKDLIQVKNVRSTGGSKILDNYIAPYDATAVKRLREVGAVFLGKTNCDEFAMGSSGEKSAYGPTKNPYDLERVPGGTSSGSAVAMAADMAVWTLGTDTGGSSRQPAAFCGVVGLKPTYGRISRYGVMAAASSLEQIGVLTKTVEDAAIVLSAIVGEDKMDSTTAQSSDKDYDYFLTGDVRGTKIGIVKEYFESLNSEMKSAMTRVVEKYKKMGAEIVEIELPHVKYSLPVFYIINPCEISSNLARYDGVRFGMKINDQEKSETVSNYETNTLLENYLDSRKYGLGAEAKRRIMLGTYALSAGYYDAYYLKAQKVRTLIRKDFERAFDKIDLILTPTTPTPAFKFGEKTADPVAMYLEDIFTVTANIAGVPALSVPCGMVEWEGKQLPVGFQLMGKWFDEEGVLRAGHAYEISAE